MVALLLSDLPVGKADGEDLIGERDRSSQVQQGDVSVQVFFPVVLRMDDDIINRHDLLNALLKPGE